MFDSLEKKFEKVLSNFDGKKDAVVLISKAFDYAKKLHGNQTRKDGKLYLTHPVEVSLILADLGFDEDVVSAALLHDVVEDCDCDLETIKAEFNNDIAEMVDCVSAIDKEQYIFDNEDLYEIETFEKASREEQSFKKLISIGKKNPSGFCIKFADRLHNLRTIDCFEYSKQLEKVKETEKWILPIAKALNTEYFYRSIENECFKIKNKEKGKQFLEQYLNYHKVNAQNIENLQIKLQEIFSSTCIKTIKIKNVREYKVYEDICSLIKNANISKISQGQIIKVTNYNIYLLYKNKKYNEVIGEMLNIINKKLTDMRIIDAKVGNFTKKPYFQLEDKFKNKYNLYVMSVSDYQLQRNGTLDGQDVDLLDEENIDSLNVEYIKVKTRSGEVKYIPKGSTVLDFAFKIHRDIGFGFKYAIINNSKTKAPPYTKLYEGDKIEIFVDKNENGEIKNVAELRWFAYVSSDFAKKNLIKCFEKYIVK